MHLYTCTRRDVLTPLRSPPMQLKFSSQPRLLLLLPAYKSQIGILRSTLFCLWTWNKGITRCKSIYKFGKIKLLTGQNQRSEWYIYRILCMYAYMYMCNVHTCKDTNEYVPIKKIRRSIHALGKCVPGKDKKKIEKLTRFGLLCDTKEGFSIINELRTITRGLTSRAPRITNSIPFPHHLSQHKDLVCHRYWVLIDDLTPLTHRPTCFLNYRTTRY